MKKTGWGLLFGVVAALAGIWLMQRDGGKAAAEAPSGEASNQPREFGSLADIQAYYNREMLVAVQQYLLADRERDDREEAYQWAMQTTLEHGWYELGGPLAAEYLERYGDHGSLVVAVGAELVSGLSSAQQDDYEGALAVFESHLARDNPQLANVAMSFADMLAVEFALAGKHEAAKTLYEKLLEVYGSSPFVKDRAESRAERLELLGKPAPRIAADDREGDEVNLDDYKGKVVFLDFWATWCGPCLEEMPNLKAVYEAYHDEGLEIIGINLDDSPQALEGFLEKNPLPWRHVFGANAAEDPIQERYRTGGTIPATYLIDQEGKLVAVDVRGKRIHSAVRELLGIEG